MCWIRALSRLRRRFGQRDNDPITDNERLYRRVSVKSRWYDPASGRLDPQAFAPHKTEDVTGLSVARAKYKSAAEAAQGDPGRSYFVAALQVGQMRARGIRVVPRPLPGDPGHAELPDMNAANYKAKETRERQRILVELTIAVEGPFETPQE